MYTTHVGKIMEKSFLFLSKNVISVLNVSFTHQKLFCWFLLFCSHVIFVETYTCVIMCGITFQLCDACCKNWTETVVEKLFILTSLRINLIDSESVNLPQQLSFVKWLWKAYLDQGSPWLKVHVAFSQIFNFLANCIYTLN